MKIILIKSFPLLLFLFFFSTNNYCQKIKREKFTCSIKEIHKENLRTCGDVKLVFKGVINVKSKSDLKGEYPFYFASMGDNISILTLKNNENKALSPTLQFDELKREFYYNKGKEDQQKIFVSDDKNDNEVILEGMIFWLKIKSIEK